MSAASQPSPQDQPTAEERRTGPKDRRVAREDRRNLDRVLEELSPRRNPDMAGRREGDLSF